MPDLIGRLVGNRYRVVRRLGSGGVAEVYEAVHEEIGRHFALKVLKREFAACPEVAERFLTEARAASAVRHPGVVQIFDYGKLDDGEPFLVMELLEGETLAELLERRKKLPQDQALGLMIQMLDALDAAHRAGIIHRDLKPENVVLVRGLGDEPWAKLIDFGIARLAYEGAASLRLTVQGTVMGTPYYMSPEQTRGASNVDWRADVYAAGVMLYELLTGKLPFVGRSAQEILSRVLSEPFPSALELEPALPAALGEAILKATMRDRGVRFQSAREFAEALRPLRSELVVVQFLSEEAAPPQTSMRRSLTPPPPRRSQPPLATARNTIVVSRRTVAIAASLGIVVAAAAVGALLVGLSDRTPRPSDAVLPGAFHLAGAAPAARTVVAVAEPVVQAPEPPSPAEPPPAEPPPALLPPALVPQANVLLVGLPDGAQAILDGVPVGPALTLEVSEDPHLLRVVARGYRPFVHEFRVAGDIEIWVSLERERSDADRPTRPAVPNSAVPRPLANPFGEP